METSEALVKIENAHKLVKEVAESELADGLLRLDASTIVEDLEMLESELRDVVEASDEALEEDGQE